MNVEQQYILYLDQQSVFCAMPRRIFEVTRHVIAPDPECLVTGGEIAPERWQELLDKRYDRKQVRYDKDICT